jgi:hypothetical protein
LVEHLTFNQAMSYGNNNKRLYLELSMENRYFFHLKQPLIRQRKNTNQKMKKRAFDSFFLKEEKWPKE